MSAAGDEIRRRPLPKRARPPTEEQYKFPDGSICYLRLGAYHWEIENASRGTWKASSLALARAIKDQWLTDYWKLKFENENKEKNI